MKMMWIVCYVLYNHQLFTQVKTWGTFWLTALSTAIIKTLNEGVFFRRWTIHKNVSPTPTHTEAVVEVHAVPMCYCDSLSCFFLFRSIHNNHILWLRKLRLPKRVVCSLRLTRLCNNVTDPNLLPYVHFLSPEYESRDTKCWNMNKILKTWRNSIHLIHTVLFPISYYSLLIVLNPCVEQQSNSKWHTHAIYWNNLKSNYWTHIQLMSNESVTSWPLKQFISGKSSEKLIKQNRLLNRY